MQFVLGVNKLHPSLFSIFLLHRPIPLNHRNHCLPKYPNIHSDIPLADILCIQFHNLFKIGDLTSATHLPHSGNAWFDRKSCSVMKFILIPLIQCRWTGSYDAHITFQYIKELWEFIQAGDADEVTDAGFLRSVRQDFITDDTGIKVQLEHHAVADTVLFHQFGFPFFCIHIHAAEFVHFEFLTVFTDTLLGKEDRTRGLQVNSRTHEQSDQQSQQTAKQTTGDIDRAFHKQLFCGCIVDTGCQYGIWSDFFHQLFFTAHRLGDFRQVQMYRHTRFRKLFHQSIRIGNIGCRNDKYLVDPLPADISSCIFESMKLFL